MEVYFYQSQSKRCPVKEAGFRLFYVTLKGGAIILLLAEAITKSAKK